MATIKDRIDGLKNLATQLMGTVSAQALVIAALGDRIEVLESAAEQPIPVSISGVPPMAGAVGERYSFIPIVSNGAGAKVFTLASGILLGGLSFSTTTGAISGMPNVAGTMSGIVVRVRDDTGFANTQATNVTIAAAASLRPTTYPSLADNGNGTYTVTPGVWPQGTVVSGQTKRRDSAPVNTGFSGTTLTRVDADAMTFIDYAETGALSGTSGVAASNGFAIPVAATLVFDPAYPAAAPADGSGKFTELAAVLRTNSVGATADKNIFSLSKSNVSGSNKALYGFGSNVSAPFYLLADTGSQTYGQEFVHVFGSMVPVFDYDAATGNHWRFRDNGGYMGITVVQGGVESTPQGDAGVRQPGYPSYPDTPSKKCRIELTVNQLAVTTQNASGELQTQLFPRPALTSGKTSKTGFRWAAGNNGANQDWVLSANAAAVSITGIERSVDGKFRATGSWQGSAPSSITYRVFDNRGKLIIPATVMTTTSFANNSIDVISVAADGRNPGLTGQPCRFEFWDTAVPSLVFPIAYTVAGYVAPVAAVFGANLADIGNPYGSARTFADAFRSGYYQDTANNYVGVSASEAGKTDADGWPLSQNIRRQIGHPATSGETMLITWTGTGAVSTLNNTEGDSVVSEGTVVSANSYSYKHTFTHTNRSASFIGLQMSGSPKNINIYPMSESRTNYWAPTYINFLSPSNSGYAGVIRVMDARGINGVTATFTTWANRSDPDKLFYGSDLLPTERCIQLANAAGRDLYLPVNPYAEDDYYTQLAIAICTGANLSQGKPWSNGLSAGRKWYFEISNEIWNPAFMHFNIFRQKYSQRTGEPIKGDSEGGVEQVFKEQAYRHQKIVQLIKAAVPTQWASKIVFVIASQRNGYDYDVVYNSIGGTDIDALAVAPYFHVDQAVLTAVTDRTPAGFEPLFRQAALDVMEALAPVKAKATSRNHRFITYEGGADFATGGMSNNEIAALRESQSWYRINYAFFKKWKDSYGDVYTHYNDVGRTLGNSAGPNGRYQWGLQLYEGQADRYGVMALQDVTAGVAPRY